MKRNFLAALAGALWLAGCAGNPQVAEGEKLVAEGNVEQGLAMLEKAARENPTDAVIRGAYQTTRQTVLGSLLAQADSARVDGRYDDAEAAYRKILRVAPTDPYALYGLVAIGRERRNARLIEEARAAAKSGDFAVAERKAAEVLTEDPSNRAARAVMRQVVAQRSNEDMMPPVLKTALAKPVSIEFRDAPLRSIFEVLSRGYGVNFVFDRDVRPDMRTTIYVRDGNLDEVIRLILVTNQLDRKVVNENTLLIFPKTPQKQRQYEELVVRSFYLANADAKQTAAMLRALVKTRDLFIDEKLNLVVIKDTPDAVRLAEKLVASQDLGEPEVMLELEVMEVQSSRLQELGLKFPEKLYYGAPFPPGQTGTGDLPFPPVTRLSDGGFRVFVTNPAIVANLRAQVGQGNLLANPRVRVKNRDKAKIHIGEKVPVVTSTSAVNVGVSTSVSYLDVGLKLDVEPNVHLDDDVAIKVTLEVSNILEQIVTNNTVAYRLGTRNAATTLRLRDGETQVLAGLINDEERKASSRVPGLGDLPTIGRLFSSDLDDNKKTEIVLLITPHIVRNLTPPLTVPAVFSSGTDADIGAAPLRTRAAASPALAISSSGGPGQASPVLPRTAAPAAQPSAPAPQFGLLFAAPSQARAGSEFSVRLAVPTDATARNVVAVVAYDPKAVEPLGGTVATPGRLRVNIAGPSVPGAQPTPTELRFRILGEATGSTQIRVESAVGTDSDDNAVGVSVPGPQQVAILPPS